MHVRTLTYMALNTRDTCSKACCPPPPLIADSLVQRLRLELAPPSLLLRPPRLGPCRLLGRRPRCRYHRFYGTASTAASFALLRSSSTCPSTCP